MANREMHSRSAVERSLREAQRDFDKRIDEIRAELKEKGPEAADQSLSDLKVDVADTLREARESFESARESLESAHKSFDDALETGRTTIQEQPLTAVGVAAAVGIVIGLLFG